LTASRKVDRLDTETLMACLMISPAPVIVPLPGGMPGDTMVIRLMELFKIQLTRN
jgi:hypothetical protein